jgi:prepilin-type N-terminal cleavage/methylation domain-containing protein
MRDRKGFTLIELLIVVVIIGILAAIAIPKFSSTREKAYVSAMKSDLKNLATQEEIYYSDQYTYSSDLTALEFAESSRVQVTVGVATTTGWAADAIHQSTDVTCSVFYGDAAGTASVTGQIAGQIACTNDPGGALYDGPAVG